ncbi:transcriptional regulator family: Fungal Specific TF [Paecilomyces variotii]|nr:transcriptional regulator family: Fungal Specific TF [Paecilomyces variotii]
MSPWLDISDAKCHFGNEVPRRALHEPMLLFALLAVASRHDSIMRGSGELESSTYHGQCLELLIPSLSRPEETYDGNLLVTVVLLRHYEELENQTDERRHFLGSTSLLNAVAKFSASGGLVEATSWLFLRQAIYVSLVLHEPLELRLENYELSDAFRLRDDGSYTNVIVFLFAKILRYIYNGAEYSNSPEDWYFLQREIESWHDSKPASFTPLNHGEADPDSGKLFPEFWMLSSAAAVGMQYYYGAMLLLTIHKPLAQSAGGFEAAKVMRIAEVAAASYLADIIGIAISNDTTENAHFTASHFICSYGYCLSHEAQRKGAIDYLKRVKEIMGWNTCWIVEALKSQWSELDEFVKRPLKVT